MATGTERLSVNKTPKRRLRWVVACVIAGCAQGLAVGPQEQGELKRFTFTEYHMGIDARLVVYATSVKTAETACEAAFKRIAELDSIMSDYRPDSELNRLCAAPPNTPVRVSTDLFRVLYRSQLISEQSGGAFDITVGPIVRLWRQARRDGKLPDRARIEAAKSRVGWRKLRLDWRARTATLAVAGMQIDLGGIAKGYASDEALRELRNHRVDSALIEMGGDIVLGDAPPNAEGWKISVPNAPAKQLSAEHLEIRAAESGNPEAGSICSAQGARHERPWVDGSLAPQPCRGCVPLLAFSQDEPSVYLKNCAISSSGDTEQFVVIGGVTYSHVVDPKTGYGLSKRVQATVIAKDGFTSDPLSTALTLVDERGRAALLRPYPSVRTYIKQV